jgi:cupin fold WbuC family metalloprotein
LDHTIMEASERGSIALSGCRAPPWIRRFESRVNPGQLLHAIVDTNRMESRRTDIAPQTEWLQLAVLRLEEGASIAPHTHRHKAAAPAATPRRTQEAWLVLRGAITVSLYDEDRALLEIFTLQAGNILVTFQGGHGFSGSQVGTVLVECKNGPYEGRDYDAICMEREGNGNVCPDSTHG